MLPSKVALLASSDLHWPSFSGPYSRLLDVRSEGWLWRYKECMSGSTEAQDGLEGIEASIGDLVPVFPAKKSKVQMALS